MKCNGHIAKKKDIPQVIEKCPFFFHSFNTFASLMFVNALMMNKMTPSKNAPPPVYVNMCAVSSMPGTCTRKALSRKTGTPI